MNQAPFEIISIGLGLIGMTVTTDLAMNGFLVGIFDNISLHKNLITRFYALSKKNIDYLQSLGLYFDNDDYCPIREIQIWDHPYKQAINLSSDAHDEPYLGMVISQDILQKRLLLRLQELNVFIGEGFAWQNLHIDDRDVKITFVQELQPTEKLDFTAQLLIAADGGKSKIRDELGLSATNITYRQIGIIGQFAVEKDHQNIARQWMNAEKGILAWLPAGDRIISVVWSHPQGEILLAESAENIAHRVGLAGNFCLGEMRAISPIEGYLLRLQKVSDWTRARIALVGDSAHQIHPMAGQGLNLGLQDAQELSALLKKYRGKREIGNHFTLREYERKRKYETILRQKMTDGLYHLFSHNAPTLKQLRQAVWDLPNKSTFVNTLLMQYLL